MPDRVTSYRTDDGNGGMYLRFVSDEADKFDEGELFCAQMVQSTPCADADVCVGFDSTNPSHANGAAAMFHASVSRLSMRKAKASEIKLALTDFNKTGASIKFSDMFDVSGFNITDPTLSIVAIPQGSEFPCATGFKGTTEMNNTISFQPDPGARQGYVGVLGPLKPVELYSAASSRSNKTNSASGYDKGCGLANRCDTSGSRGNPQFEHCKLQLSLKQMRQREMQGPVQNWRAGS
jgi:hypothetical protein